MSEFGDQVRIEREKRGWSQDKLAEAVGTTQSTVDRIEKGVTKRSRHVIEIAAELRLPLPGTSETPPPRQVEFTDAPNAPDIDRGTYPRNVPVRGIAVGGEDADFTINGDTGDFVRRPPGLEGKRGVYALHVNGESMWPAHRHGALVYVDSNRLPGAGDDAVIELHPEEPQTGEPGRGFLKRVKRIGPSKILVEQFNPPRDLEFERSEIKSFHRVIPWEEVIGY